MLNIHVIAWYNNYHGREVKPVIDKWIEKVKKLRKLLKEIAKLLIELVSIVGWILILIGLFR